MTKNNVPEKTIRKNLKKIERNVLKSFKLNAKIGEHPAGSIVSLKCDKKTSQPVERFWRKRLKDSVVDNCMEPYKEPKKAKVKEDNPENENNSEG